ncbi:glutathione S-transferase N-terminal domain-containing protein [Sorangium sp. So ce134]
MTPLTLYFSPNSISLATIIVLEEIGAPYVLQRVDLAKDEQRSAAYLELNPLGRVPTLRTQDGLLTEPPALLAFLARSAPAAELLPTGAFLEARAL